MKRQQIIAIVVVLVLAGAAGAGYQFYFRPQLEKFAEQQQYLGQLNTKLTTLKKTFPGGKPEAAVKRVTEMIQPWNDTLEQRARQFTIRDFKKIDPLPQTDLLKAYYAQTAQKMHDELLTELAVKGVYYNPAIDFYFQMAQPSAVQGRAVNAMQVTYWLAMMKMGDSITRMLIDSEILGIDNLSLWAPHPEGEGFVSYAVGASMWMTMDQFCKLLEKLQSDETMCITVQGFRIGNTALRAYVDPPLRIELVFTIDQYKYEPGAPVGAGPAGGAANNEMMAAMKAKKSTLSITEKPASKSWWSSLIPWSPVHEIAPSMNDINSKIRKVGLWAWNQKEKMFLAALLIVLCFRVYMLLANPPGVTAEQTPPKAPLHSTKTPGTTEGSMMVSANDVPEPPPRPVLERPDDFRPLVRQNPFTIYGAATGGKSSSDAEGDTIDVTLNNIVKWNDGTYRAELTTKVTGKPKRYKAGEEFENYKLMSIDPQNKTVTIYSTALGKTVELKMQ